MEMRIKLPVGIESFEEIRKYGYYYVDKTELIRERTKPYETDRF